MKDLLIYVADADALAFMRSTLQKHQALCIRAIRFDIERHPQRDSGMVQSGAELARMKKGYYSKALLMWDHHGSGCEHRQTPEQIQAGMQAKLDSYTWKDNSAVILLVPELEQWLWYCQSAVAAHCGLSAIELDQWLADRIQKLRKSVEALKQEQPKELFEYVVRAE